MDINYADTFMADHLLGERGRKGYGYPEEAYELAELVADKSATPDQVYRFWDLIFTQQEIEDTTTEEN